MKTILILAILAPSTLLGWDWAKTAKVANCIAAGADLATTAYASQHGLRETNPILGRRDGSVRWHFAVPAKAATCAIPFLFHRREPAFLAAGMAGSQGFVAIRNIRRAR